MPVYTMYMVSRRFKIYLLLRIEHIGRIQYVITFMEFTMRYITRRIFENLSILFTKTTKFTHADYLIVTFVFNYTIDPHEQNAQNRIFSYISVDGALGRNDARV